MNNRLQHNEAENNTQTTEDSGAAPQERNQTQGSQKAAHFKLHLTKFQNIYDREQSWRGESAAADGCLPVGCGEH